MRLPVHNKLPLEAWAFLPRWNALQHVGKRKMELTMKQLLASPSLQLVTYPASATAQSAEFASADCVTGLNEIGQSQLAIFQGIRRTWNVSWR